MRYFPLAIFILMAVTTYAQTGDAEYWRNQAYQSKMNDNLTKAISCYQKVLTFDEEDYDARLALARLYTLTGSYDSAIQLFNGIYVNDSTDVEALNGLGECYGLLGQVRSSIRCFEKALSFNPGETDQYFLLATAYTNSGRLNDAIALYNKINETDSTYSEAWAGLGKLYYWKGMPLTAASCYRRAIELDPENEEIMPEYDDVLTELKYGLTIKVKPLQEREENYEINALITSIKFEKRINDYFHIDANFLLDYSSRDFTNDIGDTTRWYNSSWIKASMFKGINKFSVYGGYSATDSKVTTYGLSWLLNTQLGIFSIKNSITAGYDYFYYWNKVGSKSATEEFQIGYGVFRLNARYTLGSVDEVMIKDVLNDTSYVHSNDFNSFGFSLSCKVLSKPEISIGLNHAYLDYKYKSTLYYSPFGRKLTGASVSFYHTLNKFFLYGNYAYNLGTEFNYEQLTDVYEKVNLDVDNWSADIELGYNYSPFSFSLGLGRFYNPYYRSLTGFVAVKVLF